MITNTKILCPIGEQLARRYRDAITFANGDVTPLYWHLHECDICRHLRDLANAIGTENL